MSQPRSKAPELLTDLTQHIALALRELVAMEAGKAEHVAKEVTERMAAHWGGQNVYFPMGQSAQLSRRDRQIYTDFNGTNHSELARQYGVSLQWIYKIIKAVRKEEITTRQGDMFGLTD